MSARGARPAIRPTISFRRWRRSGHRLSIEATWQAAPRPSIRAFSWSLSATQTVPSALGHAPDHATASPVGRTRRIPGEIRMVLARSVLAQGKFNPSVATQSPAWSTRSLALLGGIAISAPTRRHLPFSKLASRTVPRPDPPAASSTWRGFHPRNPLQARSA